MGMPFGMAHTRWQIHQLLQKEHCGDFKLPNKPYHGGAMFGVTSFFDGYVVKYTLFDSKGNIKRMVAGFASQRGTTEPKFLWANAIPPATKAADSSAPAAFQRS